ncbi:MAG: sigma-70 family RNA polymerase sigma factor [bacterium]|nr:sigma-70 family RNA polymerase sigma factor [bacterium]
MTAVESKENVLQDVFRTAYREYYPIVNGSIYTKIGDKETADDLTQDVFLTLFEKLDEVVNKRKNVRGWLFKTVEYKLIKYYQKVKKMPEDLATLEATGDIALTYINGFKDTRMIIKEALEITITDDKDQNIFDLVAVQNYSYREVSQEIGLSYKQVRYRYEKIVRNIQDYLKKEKGITKLEDLL